MAPITAVKVFVHLRDTATGFEDIYEMDYEPKYLDNLPFMFGEGNYCCDCNRSLFLYEFRGRLDVLDGQRPWLRGELECNSGPNRIVVDKVVDGDGNVLYADAVAA